MTTTLDSTRSAPSSRGMNIGLWVAQGLLGFAMTMAGLMKSTQPIEALSAKMPWVHHFPDLAVRGIGVVEFLGGVGLILPSALRIMPRLTVFAALGLVLVMLGAAGTEVAIGNASHAAAPVVFMLMAAFIAWGRSSKAPISSR